MRKNLNPDIFNKINFLTGSEECLRAVTRVVAREPFDAEIVDFLSSVSKEIIADSRSGQYSDVVTFAFWIRRASINKLKERSLKNDGLIRLGRGIAFHVAPSNVPVNFAYSLVAGLINGNANIVRVPSRKFEQVDIISKAFNNVLNNYDILREFVLLVRYEKDREINDLFSSIADVRIVWGGDETIAELRKSMLPPRSTEITFADRYSLAVIDADTYLSLEDKRTVAKAFYNDTFFSDQNACTSPRIIIWMGKQTEKAKDIFWEEEHLLVEEKYPFHPIQAVNKLTNIFLVAESIPGCKVEGHSDNLIFRLRVPEVNAQLMDFIENSGFFFEYDCRDLLEIRDLCDDKRCQTVSYIGNKDMFIPLLKSGITGIDRIVPLGRTMDFDLIWDGYDLSDEFTRIVKVE